MGEYLLPQLSWKKITQNVFEITTWTIARGILPAEIHGDGKRFWRLIHRCGCMTDPLPTIIFQCLENFPFLHGVTFSAVSPLVKRNFVGPDFLIPESLEVSDRSRSPTLAPIHLVDEWFWLGALGFWGYP